jgi:hypothetical protein
LDLQQDAMIAAGVDPQRIDKDLASGRKDDRPGLRACLKALQPGNTLVGVTPYAPRLRGQRKNNFHTYYQFESTAVIIQSS